MSAITHASRLVSSVTSVGHHCLRSLIAVSAMAQEMTFIEHLEEFATTHRMGRGFDCSSVRACAGCIADDLYNIASAPIRSNPAVTLSVSRPQDIFALNMKVTLVAAIFFAAPLILTQAWLFISPGLHRHERRYAIPFVLSASVLFITGGAFGYYIAFPTALRFLLDWIVASHLTPIIDAVEYFDLFFSIIGRARDRVPDSRSQSSSSAESGSSPLGCCCATSSTPCSACAVIAAVITPTSDFGNMLIIAGPMVVLYAVGIVIAWIFGRARMEAQDELICGP